MDADTFWSALGTLTLNAADIGPIERTAGGLNIVGGRTTVHGHDALLKLQKDEASARAQACADAIKPLFGARRIGCRVFKLNEPVMIGGSMRKRGSWVLAMRWLDGLETAKAATTRLRGPAQKGKVDLRARDGPIFTAWLEAVVLRLLVYGARDPWSNVGWLEAEQRAVSFDEGTAFSDTLAPGSGWPYLESSVKLRAEMRARLFIDGAAHVDTLARRWGDVTRKQLMSVLCCCDPQHGERRAYYVLDNVTALRSNFQRLCGVSAALGDDFPQLIGAADVPFVEPPADERAYNKQTFLGDYNVALARSWLQKAARRGLVVETRFAAMLMLASQNITNLTGRLATMAVEDVLSPRCVVAVHSLLSRLWELQAISQWREMRNWAAVREMLAAAATHIALEPTSRIADHAAAIYFKPDHPYVWDGMRGWVPPPDAPERSRSLEDLVEILRSRDAWSLPTEERLLYAAGGIWNTRLVLPAQLIANARIEAQDAPLPLRVALAALADMFSVIHARGAHKGKLFVIAALLFAYRGTRTVPREHALCAEPLAPLEPMPWQAEYAALIDGSVRLPVPQWAHDKHTGVREGKSEFCAREHAACVGDGAMRDPYADMAIVAERFREAHEKSKPRVKRVCA
jgi:hypothetical protein